MTPSRFAPAALLLLLAASPPAPAAPSSPRPDAPDAVGPFLRLPAQSLSQLVREVRRDTNVRRRYAEFFHVPDAQVVPYLSKNLRAGTLPRDGSYTVFYVSATGAFYPTRMALAPGTPVFVRRDGVPVLLRGAGNPLTPFTMAVRTVIVSPPAPASPVQEQVVPATGPDIPVPAP